MIPRRAFYLLLACLEAVFPAASALAAPNGGEVVVVYNRAMGESAELAFYYARKRGVPTNQVFGLDLPTTETITRAQYRKQLEQPLLEALQKTGCVTYAENAQTNHAGLTPPRYRLVSTKIRYAVLCYGVPSRILKDPDHTENGLENTRAELRRNEAAVDNELACLPYSKNGYQLAGFLANPLYQTTNALQLSPTNGLLMTARLDGPSPTIARGLIDKAIEAERDGLWGRAYFDSRGLTNGAYIIGDQWIRGAAAICRRLGFETDLDDTPPTFSPAFPMSQIAFYAGWYDEHVSGPFTRPVVEFRPGAFAYHLHSFNAFTIRNPTAHWVGPLLEKGATITMGTVDEPYLEGTPDLTVFFARLLRGFTFGEAAYASQRALSWQTTAIGDPLYCPFGRPPQQQHMDLSARKSKLIEWSHLRVVDLNEATGMPATNLIAYLLRQDETYSSAVLTEKLAMLYRATGRTNSAVETMKTVLLLEPTPRQKTRITLELSQWLAADNRDAEALRLLDRFQTETPDYPEPLAIIQRMLPLAEKLGDSNLVERCQREIAHLAPQL